MKKKYIFLLSSFIFILIISSVEASLLDKAQHPNSQIVEKKRGKGPVGESLTYRYRSPLEWSQILNYYDDFLSRQGWKRAQQSKLSREESSSFLKFQRPVSFKKGDKLIILTQIPHTEERVTFYYVRLSNLPPSEDEQIYRNQRIKKTPLFRSIPEYPNSEKTDYKGYNSGFQIAYAALGSIQEAKKFYANKMTSSGWKMQKEGKMQNFYPLIKEGCSSCAQSYEEVEKYDRSNLPEGPVLHFTKEGGDKRCLVSFNNQDLTEYKKEGRKGSIFNDPSGIMIHISCYE